MIFAYVSVENLKCDVQIKAVEQSFPVSYYVVQGDHSNEKKQMSNWSSNRASCAAVHNL